MLLEPSQADLSLKGKEFAIVRNSPQSKLPLFTIVKVNGGNVLNWSVPAEACDHGHVSWFLIKGMQSKEELAGFFKDPGKWTWAFARVVLRPGSTQAISVPVARKGTPVVGRGRIVGSARRSFPDFKASVRAQLLPSGSLGKEWTGSHIGIDKRSGDFWIQSDSNLEAAKLVIDIVPVDGKGLRYMPVENYPVKLDEPMLVKLIPEAVLEGAIRVFDAKRTYPLMLELRQGAKLVLDSHLWWDHKFRLRGLAAGLYDLKVLTVYSHEVLSEQTGLRLVAGKTLRLPHHVDVRRFFRSIRIQVQDDRGRPLKASLDQGYSREGDFACFPVPMAGKGTWDCLIRPTGGRFLIKKAGFAPRFLEGIKADQVVTLYRPFEILVVIRNWPEEKGAFDNLFIQCTPEGGYPVWVWKLLKMRMERLKNPSHRPSGTPNSLYCLAPVQGREPIRVKVTKPGKWRLRLYYERGSRQVFVPSKKIIEVVVSSKRKAVVIKLDPDALELARKKMQTGR